MPTPKPQRYRRANRLIQIVAGYVQPHRLAVDVDLYPLGFRTAVVADRHMLPATGREPLLRDDLQGILGPLVNDMGTHIPIL